MTTAAATITASAPAAAAATVLASSDVDILLLYVNISVEELIRMLCYNKLFNANHDDDSIFYSRSVHNETETKWKHTDSFPIYERNRDKCVYNNFSSVCVRVCACISSNMCTTHILFERERKSSFTAANACVNVYVRVCVCLPNTHKSVVSIYTHFMYRWMECAFLFLFFSSSTFNCL